MWVLLYITTETLGLSDLCLLQVPGKVDPVRQQVPVLLPHEILHAVWHSGDAQERIGKDQDHTKYKCL